MKSWLKWGLAGLVLALLAAGALRAISTRNAQKEALQAQQESQKTQAVVELLATDTFKASTITLPQTLALSGALKAVNSVFVKARIAGELQGLVVREGSVVKAGDTIARVDATEFLARERQARQQVQSAKGQLDIAKRTNDNNRSLVDQGFISKTALDLSAANLASAEANFQAAQAGADVLGKSLDDTVLRAPISGVVAQRLAQPGERVSVDARIVEIVDLSQLELEAGLSAADSMQVQIGQLAQLTVEGASKPLSAKVVRINPSATPGSRAVLVYLAVAPTPGLRQGLFAQGTLETGSTRSMALPLTAVRTDKPQPYVQVLANGQVVHQIVTLGTRSDLAGVTMVSVQGIAEGATLLQGTVGSLRAGTLVKLAAAGQ